MELNPKKTAVIFKAFCDENRIKILQLLTDGEKCACKLLEALNITQPTLSHHMKILLDSGIVNGRKEGKWMHYSISEEGLKDATCSIKFANGKTIYKFTIEENDVWEEITISNGLIIKTSLSFEMGTYESVINYELNTTIPGLPNVTWTEVTD